MAKETRKDTHNDQEQKKRPFVTTSPVADSIPSQNPSQVRLAGIHYMQSSWIGPQPQQR